MSKPPLHRRALVRASTLVSALALSLVPAAVADTPAGQTTAGAAGSTPSLTGTGLPASTPLSTRTPAAATLTQCATATLPQTERSAAFAGEMIALAGTARMEMRVGLEERAAGEARYRLVRAPGLGGWRSSNPGVKAFAHIQQVTNLSAPASYRGLVAFRWLNAQGHTIKLETLRTAGCEQPSSPASTGAQEAAQASAGSA